MKMVLPIRLSIIAHHRAALNRGYSQNSLEAICPRLDAGVPFIEIDIATLAEQDYLLVYDADFRSETTSSGAVRKASVEEVRPLFNTTKGVAKPFHAALLNSDPHYSGGSTKHSF